MVTNDQWVTHPPMPVLVGGKLVPLILFMQTNDPFLGFPNWIGLGIFQDLSPRQSVEGEWSLIDADLTLVIHNVHTLVFRPTNCGALQITIRHHVVQSGLVEGVAVWLGWILGVSPDAPNLIGHVRASMRNIEFAVKPNH